MDVKTVIGHLSSASGPDRSIDNEIADIIKSLSMRNVANLWPQNGQALYFTRDIDAAYALAKAIAPAEVGALSWERDEASASFRGRQPVRAQTAPIALCVATLKTIV